jgi:hypothetical protein
MLDLPRRTAVLHVRRTYFIASGRPVECASVHYRPDQYRLRVELVPGAPEAFRPGSRQPSRALPLVKIVHPNA